MTVQDPRPFTLGGSRAAAAAGIDPFCSRVMLWAQMTGRVEPPDTEQMWWGRALEPVIDRAMGERGYDLMPAPDGVLDTVHPWLVGHPDGFAELDGERVVYERKTIGQWAHRANGDNVPVQYQAQAQVYMHLAGLDRALVATLVGGQRLEVGTVERSDDAIGCLLDLMREFHDDYLRLDRPPPPDGSDSAKAAVIALFPEAEPAKLYRLSRDEWRLVTELRARREQRDVIDAQIAELESTLKLAMGDAETALSPHDTDALHWRNVHTTRVDTTALKTQRPDVAREYSKVTTTRRFLLA